MVGSAVGNGVGQVVPMKSLPVVTLQLATLLERAWTSVGTSAQSLFERRSKSKLIWSNWPSSVGIAAESEFEERVKVEPIWMSWPSSVGIAAESEFELRSKVEPTSHRQKKSFLASSVFTKTQKKTWRKTHIHGGHTYLRTMHFFAIYCKTI